MNPREILEHERDTYNQRVSHPLQSWEWGEFRKELGQKVFRTENYQVFFHHLPQIPFTIGYFPKGPLPDKEMVEILTKVGKENKTIFIKLEPNAPKLKIKNEKLKINLGLTPGRPLFTKYTSLIDLTKSEEELLARMHPKTRYNTHLAQKHGVIVEEDNSSKAFNAFLKLLLETTRRQGFYAHDENFHRKQWQILHPAGISHLLVAKYRGKILATFLLFLFNKVLYYPYGASTREHREAMAPTLLMWEAIRFGKKTGCQTFDLWGETSPEAKPSDPWFGWHRFKQSFGPEIVEFVGTYDLVLNPTLYQIYRAADWARWKFLRIKARLNKQWLI
jgi:lipid II:glycine glycyltransferase (peptidoglycan interpeptide bridge formation enzyme)